ncbi:lysine N(6)-hydroxylase/L-ornithine N(5)-oxygenase family protein [Priestia endophytica]|jgi:lysine N6-hydroxylase|uniref:lysine N(6)-hydroxylase/L-ornithine N(5)-oxygenase family protein n=1 Tax=Priestia endophytica TaxID=135735 RepID=UPI000F5350CF|nr:SidA/IucD/PvdA family monooxygenase [Priestia endophytica]RPK06283.1 hypothetical protein FH5_05452 [Priestia endophytica]
MKKIDAVIIGGGPYGLGLGVLAEEIENLEVLVFEREDSLEWHPGMLLDGTTLQDAFLADLVTLLNPKSPYTYLNYLHEHDRLHAFFFFEDFEVPRKEFSSYLKWAGSQLQTLRLRHEVTDVLETGDGYMVKVQNYESGEEETYETRHVVLGTGHEPNVPEFVHSLPSRDVFHTSRYLYRKDEIKEGDTVTIIGSGQSAAEIYYDLLQRKRDESFTLNWYTRSGGFFQMESAKMAQQLFSPDYIRYFRTLPVDKRKGTLDDLSKLRHGVKGSLLESIYKELYHQSIDDKALHTTIMQTTSLEDIEEKEEGYTLTLHHTEKDELFQIHSDKVILATGYKPRIPDWLERFENKIVWEDEHVFKVDNHYRIVREEESKGHLYTLTNLEYSHGSGATNLSLSPYRNATILHNMTGEEHFRIPKNSVFQTFFPKEEGL